MKEFQRGKPFVDALAMEVSRKGFLRALMLAGGAFLGARLGIGEQVPASANPLAKQDISIEKGACKWVNGGSVISGDISVNGRMYHPEPNDGTTGRIVRFNQGGNACATWGASGIEGTQGEIQDFINAQTERNRTTGCSERRGCPNGTKVHDFPEDASPPPSICQTDLGVEAGKMVPEAIRDRIICKDTVTDMCEWGFVQGDVDTECNGVIVDRTDSNPNTGQITRFHTGDRIRIHTKGDVDVECIGSSFGSEAMAVMDRRSGERARSMLFTGCNTGNGCFEGVKVVDVFPECKVNVSMITR